MKQPLKGGGLQRRVILGQVKAPPARITSEEKREIPHAFKFYLKCFLYVFTFHVYSELVLNKEIKLFEV